MCCFSWHFLLKSGRPGPNCPDFIHFSWLLVAVSYFLLSLIVVFLFLKFFTPRWRFVPCFLEQVIISWQAFSHYRYWLPFGLLESALPRRGQVGQGAQQRHPSLCERETSHPSGGPSGWMGAPLAANYPRVNWVLELHLTCVISISQSFVLKLNSYDHLPCIFCYLCVIISAPYIWELAIRSPSHAIECGASACKWKLSHSYFWQLQNGLKMVFLRFGSRPCTNYQAFNP